jgi:hypothetical protein
MTSFFTKDPLNNKELFKMNVLVTILKQRNTVESLNVKIIDFKKFIGKREK